MVVGPTRALDTPGSCNFSQAIWKLLQDSRTILASLYTPMHVSGHSRVIQNIGWLVSNMEVQQLVPVTAQSTSEVQFTLKTGMNQLDDFKTILSSLGILPVGYEHPEVLLVTYKATMSVPQVQIEFGQLWQPPEFLGAIVFAIKPWQDSQDMGSIPRQFMFVLTTFYYLEYSWNMFKFFFISSLFLSSNKLLQAHIFPVLFCQVLKEQSSRKEPILGPCLIKD